MYVLVTFLSYQLINNTAESRTRALAPCIGYWSTRISRCYRLWFEHRNDDSFKHCDSDLRDASLFSAVFFSVLT